MSTKERLQKITRNSQKSVERLAQQAIAKCEQEAEKGKSSVAIDFNFYNIEGLSNPPSTTMENLASYLTEVHKLNAFVRQSMFPEASVKETWVVYISWEEK